MKKQIIYIILVLVFSPLILFSQTEDLEENVEIESNRSYRQVGFNLSYLINNLLRNEIPPYRINDRNYLLSIKSRKQKDRYIRYGFSFNFRAPSNQNNYYKTIQGAIRFGYERQYLILNNKFQINPGFDLSLNYFLVNPTLSQQDNYQEIIQIGPIPFTGFQYNLNPRIHLSTEIGFAFLFSKIKRGNSVSINNNTTADGIDIFFQKPQELILSVSF